MNKMSPATRKVVESAYPVALRAAILAGRILNRQFGEVQAVEKADRTLVTAADILSERCIRRHILDRRHFPDHNFGGEEEDFVDNGSEFSWVIDPLDGTANYALGIRHFALSIALFYQSDPVLGVVCLPQQRSPNLYSAVLGEGAYVGSQRKSRLKRLIVAEQKFGRHALFGVSNDHLNPQTSNLCTILAGRSKFRVLGGSVQDFVSLTENGLIGLLTARNTKLVDIAATTLIAREAGAEVRRFSNSGQFTADPFDFDQITQATFREKHMSTAGHPEILDQIISELNIYS